MNIDGAEVIGVMGSMDSRAAFGRADVVVRGASGDLIQARRWLNGTVEGPTLTEETFSWRVEAGESLRLDHPIPVRPGLGAWFVRGNFGITRKEFLVGIRRVCTVVHEIQQGDCTLFILVESEGAWLRQEWTEQFTSAARAAIENHHYTDAARLAERAWLLARTVTPKIVALVVKSLEMAGRGERARGFRALERNSRGDAFDRGVGAVLMDIVLEPANSRSWYDAPSGPRPQARSSRQASLRVLKEATR